MSKTINLYIPFELKDTVKANNARWNPDLKLWQTSIENPNLDNIIQFTGFTQKPNIKIFYPVLFGLGTYCWKCHEDMDFLSIGTDSGYDYFDDESGELITEKRHLEYAFANVRLGIATDEKVISELNQHGLFFTYSKTAKGTYLGNRCQKCGSLQGDFKYHVEFGGTFRDTPLNELKKIHLNIDIISLYGEETWLE